MATITAVVTEDARRYFPQYFGGLLGSNISQTQYLPAGNPTVLNDVALMNGDLITMDQPGTGTIATSGTTVTGSGTAFLTQVFPGDWLVVGLMTRLVATVTSNTSLTTVQPFDPALLAGTTFSYKAVYRIVTVYQGIYGSAAIIGYPNVVDTRYVERVYLGQVFGVDIGTPCYRVRGYDVVPIISTFKLGEGGWVDFGGGAVPRIPDPTLRRLDNNIQDIDAVVDDTRIGVDERYPLTSRGKFEKQLVASNFQFVAPTTLRVECRVETTEFNDDGFGHNPEIWEIGLFSEHPVIPGEKLMVAYGTFPSQTKTNSLTIVNYVDVSF